MTPVSGAPGTVTTVDKPRSPRLPLLGSAGRGAAAQLGSQRDNSCCLRLFVQRPVQLPLLRDAGRRTQVCLELSVFLRSLEMVVAVVVQQQWWSTLFLSVSRGVLFSNKPVLRAWGRQKSSEEGIQRNKREGRSRGWSELHPVLSPAKRNFQPQCLKPWGKRELPLPGPGLHPLTSPGGGVPWGWKPGDSTKGAWGCHIRARLTIKHEEAWNTVPCHPRPSWVK